MQSPVYRHLCGLRQGGGGDGRLEEDGRGGKGRKLENICHSLCRWEARAAESSSVASWCPMSSRLRTGRTSRWGFFKTVVVCGAPVACLTSVLGSRGPGHHHELQQQLRLPADARLLDRDDRSHGGARGQGGLHKPCLQDRARKGGHFKYKKIYFLLIFKNFRHWTFLELLTIEAIWEFLPCRMFKRF